MAQPPIIIQGKLVPIRGDGNCLFAAIARYVSGQNASSLRQKAVEFICDPKTTKHKKLRNNHFGGFNQWNERDQPGPISWEDRCAKMKIDGVYGDQPEIFALSHILKRPIFTWKRDYNGDDIPEIAKPFAFIWGTDVGREEYLKPGGRNIIHIVLRPERQETKENGTTSTIPGHYDSLLPLPIEQQSAAIKKLFGIHSPQAPQAPQASVPPQAPQASVPPQASQAPVPPQAPLPAQAPPPPLQALQASPLPRSPPPIIIQGNLVTIRGDGNCLFAAIATAVLRSTRPNVNREVLRALTNELRQDAANLLCKDPTRQTNTEKKLFEALKHKQNIFITRGGIKKPVGVITWENRCKRMRKNGEYGDRPEIFALSHILETPIFTWQRNYKDGDLTPEIAKPFAFIWGTDIGRNYLKSGGQNIIHLVLKEPNTPAGHYDLLSPLPIEQQSPAIKKLFGIPPPYPQAPPPPQALQAQQAPPPLQAPPPPQALQAPPRSSNNPFLSDAEADIDDEPIPPPPPRQRMPRMMVPPQMPGMPGMPGMPRMPRRRADVSDEDATMIVFVGMVGALGCIGSSVLSAIGGMLR